jgi:hypothetical protein
MVLPRQHSLMMDDFSANPSLYLYIFTRQHSINFSACTRIETNGRSSVSTFGGIEKLCGLVGLSLFQELFGTQP